MKVKPTWRVWVTYDLMSTNQLINHHDCVEFWKADMRGNKRNLTGNEALDLLLYATESTYVEKTLGYHRDNICGMLEHVDGTN